MAEQRPFDAVEERLEAYRTRFMGRHLKAFLEGRHDAERDAGPPAPGPQSVSPPEHSRRGHAALALTIAEPDVAATTVSIATTSRVAPTAQTPRLSLATGASDDDPAPCDDEAAATVAPPPPLVDARPPRSRAYVLAVLVVALTLLLSLILFGREADTPPASRASIPGVPR